MTGEEVGPTFGESVANSALIAIIASLLVISVYIALRFEWKYAVPVLIALMHDILITAGVYALLGREVTTSTVAALLTIVGFSLYDTIIVFDRIRENVPRMPSAAFSQIVNRSMSEVIVRSLATSFCTILPVLALFLFGGDTLKDFAFALIVGTISGAYSSVFIAGPGAHALEGPRAGLPHARAPHPQGRARLPAGLRRADRAARRSTSRRSSRAAAAAASPPRRTRPTCRGRSSTRWCATSGSRRSASPASTGARVAARPAAAAPAPTAAGRAPVPPPAAALRPARQARRRGDDEGSKPKKPRNRKHGRPR